MGEGILLIKLILLFEYFYINYAFDLIFDFNLFICSIKSIKY